LIDTRLILVEGITGTGKSTTAQNLFLKLRSQNQRVKWFHEEEKAHPLFYPDWNIQWIRTADKLSNFIQKWPLQWESLFRYCNKQIVIVTSYLFQDGARVLFANNVEKERIVQFVKSITESIKDLNPVMIFLYTRDIIKTLENLWIKRGYPWMKYMYGVDEQTQFALSRNLKGTTASMVLWGEFQNFCREVFKSIDIEKIELDVSDHKWEEYQNIINQKLKLSKYIYPSVKLDSIECYCGFYISDTTHTLSCRIKAAEESLLCDFIWPDLELIPQTKTRFLIRSFPLQIEFSAMSEGVYGTVTVKGADIYGMNGQVFTRIKDSTWYSGQIKTDR